MAPVTVLVIDGVLRSSVGDGVIVAGQSLYHGMSEVGPVALLSHGDVDKDSHWLGINGFTKHVYLFADAPTDPEDEGARRLKQIRRIQSHQQSIGFLVEPDPSVAAYCILNGVPVMTFVHPRYSKPEFRPDHRAEIVSWDALTAEVTRQEELRAHDARLRSLQ